MVVRLREALDYHDRGLAVIPATAAKAARIGWKQFQKKRLSASQVREWFGGDDQHAIAVIMGPSSGGVLVRDFDAMPAYTAWAEQYPALATTLPTVATPRPGRHVYARGNVEKIRAVNGASTLDLGDGELRGAACICLLPPSTIDTKTSRGTYEWVVPFPDLPDRIPEVDLHEAGFLPKTRRHTDTQSTQHTQNTQDTQTTQAVCVSGCLCGSANAEEGRSLDSRESKAGDLEDRIKWAIAETVPEKFGQRNRRIFEFARRLKAIPELVDLPLSKLRPTFKQWHQAAIHRIRTKEFSESWIDFSEAWERVRAPFGKGRIDMIFSEMTEADIPAAALEYDLPGLQLLVRLCRELQRYHDDMPFPLNCRTAGRLLGVDYSTAAKWLRHLVRDEILAVISIGNQAKHKASEYRYLHPF